MRKFEAIARETAKIVASGDMVAVRATRDAIVAVQTAIMVATMVLAIAPPHIHRVEG